MKNIFTIACLSLFLTLSAQSDKEIAEASVEKSTIEGHIYFLADDLLMGRETGEPGNKIAASYLANSLRKFGAKPNPATGNYYQPFELVETESPKSIEVSIAGKAYPLSITTQMPKIDAEGDAIYLGYGSEADFQDTDVSGKVVIVAGGTEEDQSPRGVYMNGNAKKEMARKNGAKGLIEMVTIDEAMWSRIKHSLGSSTRIPEEKEEKDADFFYLWVNDKGEDNELKKGKNLSYSVKSDGMKEKTLKTQNVVGFIEGSDPQLKNEYIIYSAHYDHVGVGEPNAEGDSIYNGARDNAIGTTAVLSMAESLGKNPTKRSALFIFFTGEEKGLLGSKYYVQHPIMPLKNVIYCFNTDGGGYNDTSLATIIGLDRTTAKKHMVEGASSFGLKPIDDPAPEQGLFDRSDNVSFAAAGIPAPTYSTGFTAFDDEIFKYYHQVTDEAESLDFDYLVKFYKGYIYSGRLIANDPEKPFWIKGDKYEEAGNELYNLAQPLKD